MRLVKARLLERSSSTGAAPHMKGIDMSKDPYCVKANANNPAHLRERRGRRGRWPWKMWFCTSTAGAVRATVVTTVPVFDQKNCMYTPHVLAVDVNQSFKVVTSDQTAHNIHPLPNPMINIGWNQSQPPGAPPVEKAGRTRNLFPSSATSIPGCTGGMRW